MMDKPLCGIPAGARVLVTGATGFTGTVLTRRLCEAGCDVVAIARESSDIAPLSDLPITWIRGDVASQSVIDEAMHDTAYIFHMATAFRQAASSYSDHARTHITSTQRLAKAALAQKGFKRFIHVSTIGVHGHIEGKPASETSRFAPGDAYQSTKAVAELWLRDFAKNSELPYTVIRPAGIYGPGDRRLLKLFRMATRPVFPLVGSGKCVYHLIHVDDLANAMITAATHPDAAGEAFIVGDPAPITLEAIGRTVAKEFDTRIRVVRIPAWPVFALARLCEATCRPLGIEPPLYSRRVAFFTNDRMFNTRKLQTLLGYTPRIETTEGIRSTAKWYRDAGWL